MRTKVRDLIVLGLDFRRSRACRHVQQGPCLRLLGSAEWVHSKSAVQRTSPAEHLYPKRSLVYHASQCREREHRNWRRTANPGARATHPYVAPMFRNSYKPYNASCSRAIEFGKIIAS